MCNQLKYGFRFDLVQLRFRYLVKYNNKYDIFNFSFITIVVQLFIYYFRCTSNFSISFKVLRHDNKMVEDFII